MKKTIDCDVCGAFSVSDYRGGGGGMLCTCHFEKAEFRALSPQEREAQAIKENLRDEIARDVFVKRINHHWLNAYPSDTVVKAVAENSYKMADALLAARKPQTESK